MNIGDNGDIRLIEYQWCQHVQAWPLEVRGSKMMLVGSAKTAIMTSGRSICLLCMVCLADFEAGRLQAHPITGVHHGSPS